MMVHYGGCSDRSIITETKAKVAFVSAHLGLHAADTPIEMYDVRMTEQIAAAMMADELGTRWPRPRTQRRVMPFGEHPGMHIATLAAYGRHPFTEVALVGGHWRGAACRL